MIILNRRYHCFPSTVVVVLIFILTKFKCSAFQPILNHLSHTPTTIYIYEQNRGFDSIPTVGRIQGARFGNTQIALIADMNIEVEIDASTIISDSVVPLSFGVVDFGALAASLLLLLALASVGAFVYANVVYTPEILEGARDLKRSEREAAIRKLIKALQSHEEKGNELTALRVPLETAVGTTLEDYVSAVLEPDSVENSTALFTASDIELATMLKQRI